jgi:hypothetical protein
MADNQPEAMAFYAALGYQETSREHQPSWTWTLVHYAKDLGADPGSTPAVLERTPSSGLRESPLGSARPSAGADPPFSSALNC